MADGGSVRTARLYTRTGDHGETGLAGGVRISKDAPRLRAYGTLDELASQLGLAEALLPPEPAAQVHRDLLRRCQHELFTAMSELARAPALGAPAHRLEARHVTALDQDIDRLSGEVPPLTNFILPRGSPAASAVHVARTVARRAERELVALHRIEPVRPELIIWLNRLSDLLFALARVVNQQAHEPETAPDYAI
ncbi:MAG: cob(I)yrinic acid a,c-diamide adenosyltransferase [Thermoplasmata archaeon]